ncbi:MAG: hypothetical protein QM756_16025 [Polyangiaceae bacterium]
MAAVVGRIVFQGGPWPLGHGIKKARWIAVLGEAGLRFHLHVETRDYDAEDDREDDSDEDASNWDSRGVWNNYQSCTLSSTQWDHAGFVVATAKRPIDLEQLEGKAFRVDPVKGKTLPKGLESAKS